MRKNIVYLAGFFDGEGCIGFSTNKKDGKGKNRGFRISVSQINPKPLQLYIDTFNCGKICKWINKSGRLQSQWTVSGNDAKRVLIELLPYLIVKKDEAILAIKYQELPWRRHIRTIDQKNIDEELINNISKLKRVDFTVN